MRGWLFAFVLLSLAFAATPPPAVTLPDLSIENNPGFIGAIIILSISFVALSYAVSSAIQNPSAVAWSKDQLREVVAGVVVIVIVYGACTTANALVSGTTGHSNAVKLGEAVLNPIIGDLEMIYGKIGEAYFSVAVQQGTMVGVVFGLPMKLFWWFPDIYYGRDMMPFYGLSPIMQALNQSSTQVAIQILSFRVVKLFLAYIGAVVPKFLLPVGMAFRVFPFTKRTGDTLIALSLGGLFMLPASLIVVGELKGMGLGYVDAARSETFYDNVDPRLFGELSGAMISGLCQNTAVKAIFGFGEMFWGLLFALLMSLATLNFAMFYTYFDMFVSLIWPFVIWAVQTTYAGMLVGFFEADGGEMYDRTIAPIVQDLFPAVAEITVFSVMSIIVIAIITYTGTRAISTAIGGEYSFYGISRMI